MDLNNDQEQPKKQHHHSLTSQWILPLILIAAIIVILLVFRGFPLEDRAITIPHEETLEIFVGYAILAAEIAAMIVVVISVMEATVNFLRGLVSREFSHRIRSSETLRLRLGHRLGLALEFALASDILRIAISPTLSDLVFLLIIILLRFLLNFFLEDESATIKATEMYPDLEPCGKDEPC